MTNFFTAQREDIDRLDAASAVGYIRDLFWAEAGRIGLPQSNINVPDAINVADGGIDASVSNVPPGSAGILKDGIIRYQIKTGDSFKPWQEAALRNELFGRGKPETIENLASGVKSCLDQDGTYVLVCVHQDIVDSDEETALKNLKSNFDKVGFPNAKFEVWSRNKLLGFFNIFPSLALKLSGRHPLNVLDHKTWSQNGDMVKAFFPSEEQKSYLAGFSQQLRDSVGKPVHIRVTGEPGIGKTRLVLEASRPEDIASLVIYLDSPKELEKEGFMGQLIRHDSPLSAILVVDECDAARAAEIWNKFENNNGRIRLITIYPDYETRGRFDYRNPPILVEEKLGEIIESYGIPADQAARWSEYCSGSPRVAHIVGENLKSDPSNPLGSPDDVIWSRYIAGSDQLNSEIAQKRLRILRFLALFVMFGFEARYESEKKAILAKVYEYCAIDTAEALEIIQALKKRKILQGGESLYITPKLLHIKLWTDWWTHHKTPGFDINQFIVIGGGTTEKPELMPTKLIEWFCKMFKYAKQSQAANSVVEELLSERGPFKEDSLVKSSLMADFFFSLSQANPKAALGYLKRTVYQWPIDQLKEFTTGRRDVIWALEFIAVHRFLFHDAARILLKLAVAENESFSNNATGVFSEFFTLGWGKLAPTQSAPQERLVILQEIFESKKVEYINIAISACDKALETRFSRLLGAEVQGLEELPLWRPSSDLELFTAFQTYWNFLVSQLSTLESEQRQIAVKVLLNRARGLTQHPFLVETVLDTMRLLYTKKYASQRDLLKTVVTILHYDTKRLSSATVLKWEALRDNIQGNDFVSELKRKVGLHLIEDYFDEAGNHLTDEQQAERLDPLIQAVVQDPDLLTPELVWLTTKEAENGFLFGYRLSQKDTEETLLPAILKEQTNVKDNSTVFFLAGYLRGVYHRSPSNWNQILESFVANPVLKKFVPELTWRSGLLENIPENETALQRVLNMVKSDELDYWVLRIFTTGGALKQFSEETYREWLQYLLDVGTTDSITIAIELVTMRLHGEKEGEIPEDLAFRLLTHPSLFQADAEFSFCQMDDYNWQVLVKKFINDYPERTFEILDLILSSTEGNAITNEFELIESTLWDFFKKEPAQVWEKITKVIDPPLDLAGYRLTGILSSTDVDNNESDNMLNLVPQNLIWDWVKGRPEERSHLLATIVQKSLKTQSGAPSLARELLVRYGHFEDVRKTLIGTFTSGSWWGPTSQHYQNLKDTVLKASADDDDPNIQRWVHQYVEVLEIWISRAKAEEERGGF